MLHCFHRVLLATLALASLAIGQVPAYVFDGESASDNFGTSVSGAGDVNGDGFDDVIVGAPFDDNNGSASGSARVLSGFDGAVLYTFDGDSAGDWFGFSVSGAGDVNGDGYDDVIVGAMLDDNNGGSSGSARVLSGFDGAVLYSFDGDLAGDRFGESVSGAGDVNADGFDDVIIGAQLDDNNGSDSGSARVFSGFNGAVLFTFLGDSADDQFGSSVSGAGDVNGDGFDDVIIGAELDDNNGGDSGSVRVLSGFDGAMLYTFYGDSAGDWFGQSVSGAGDINADGYNDVIVGARFDDNNGSASGSARVLSGFDGAVLYTFDGDSADDQFGYSVSGAGDANGDGYDDVIVGARLDDNNGYDSGSARVLSGLDGAVLYAFDGDSPGDRFGQSVSGAGDVNGDGYDDFIIGARSDDNNGNMSGSASVFTLAAWAEQTLEFNVSGTATSRSGWSVSAAGDVNADGYDDVIVGAPDNTNGIDAGSARVLSGLNGAVLYTFSGDSPGDQFGFCVSGIGDIDNDGFDDVIVGAPYDDDSGTDSGSARVFSGQFGLELFTFYGNSANDLLGLSVSGAGDLNNDGRPDITIGAPGDSAFALGAGAVFSLSYNPATPTLPTVLWSFGIANATAAFGWAVSDLADVNGDGYDDVIVGAPNIDLMSGGVTVPSAGAFYILSGFDGGNLLTGSTFLANDRFGHAVSGAGDVDGDGLPDFVVGSPQHIYQGAADAGRAYIYRYVDGAPATFQLLYTVPGNPGAFCGYSVSGAGDVDGDGTDEVAVGCMQDASLRGFAGVYSVAKNANLAPTAGVTPGDQLGFSVSGAGDTNGDGFADVIFGAPYRNSDDGIAYLYTSEVQSDRGRAVPFGAACGAANRLARSGSSGQPMIGETLNVELHGAAPLSITLLAFGAQQQPISVSLDVLLGLPGCWLHTTADATSVVVTDSTGQASVPVAIPNDPSLAMGPNYMFQWVTLDASVVPTPPKMLKLTFSDGLLLDIGI